ncbi:hypothetical protein [Mycobacterium sp. NPDC050853]|uniref:hypothetical protein n=1 Tax=Mycobacterium sp. NPDC050853 TaxID=3155160 RepID=UPI0033D32DDA
MTAIETKEVASLVAKIVRAQVLEAMKTLVTVRVIEPDHEQDAAAITQTLQRAYDQLTAEFDLSVGDSR